MTTIAVTGATGQLGRLVVDALLARGAKPGDIVAAVRDTAKAADIAALGVQVRFADYDDASSLASAFAGVDRLLLISGNAVGQRVPQHTAVIEAAVAAQVGFIAYTSILKADSSPVGLAPEHLATGQVIAASGVPFALLRNGWYTENYAGSVAGALHTGTIAGSAGDGKIAAAPRADYAEAAAAVLLSGEAGVYELGGTAFTMSELAAEVAKQSGKDVAYTDLPVAEYQAVLVGVGLPDGYAGLLADTDFKITEGHLDTDRDDLATLIGRPTTPLPEAVAALLKG
jgi:NAD(P)H dehydrogenase (quinone)